MPSAHQAAVPSSLSEKTSQWFDRASASLLGQLPCKAGCCRCCIGPFPITLFDYRQLRDALSQLPREQRLAIHQQAVRQVGAMEALFPQLQASPFLDTWPDRLIDRLVDTFHDLPCPALDREGRCLVYASRPLVCRSMGIPIEQADTVTGACEVQTAVPIVRLSPTFREEEHRLAEEEARVLSELQAKTEEAGEELLLPYGFLPKPIQVSDSAT
ncbi:MAG: YkgJ family cysteine cluster protein [Nitrospira sp.]